jgi:phage shock protein A
MGLFSRIGTLFRSNINELINKAEDPEKMLNQVLVDMKSQLVEAKKQVAVAIADEKRIKKQLDQERAKAADWERKAMLAVKAGDDGLARAALARKADHEEIATTLEAQWESQRDAVAKLKEALRGLDSKIDEAKRKRNILVSRKKRAEAQQIINDTLASINSTGSNDTFERMEDRITQLEAESEATAELGALPESSLESQFRALEAGNVDDELAALKQKMALKAAESAPKAIEGDAGEESDDDRDEPDLEATVDATVDEDLESTTEEASRAAEVDAALEELKRKLQA